MSDEQFRFAISPIVTERNARCLINIMAESFPCGATSRDLLIRFEEVTGLKRQMYYDTLAYVKYRRWVVGGGHSKLYQLNSDQSWKPTQASTEQILEKDRLEYLADTRAQQIGELQDEVARLRDFSGGASGADVAVSTLVQIVSDSSASTRQRIKAAGAILGYRVQDDGVIEFVKGFLQSVCMSADTATDYRTEAAELLRKHEAPRVMSEIVRPNYRDDDNAEPPEPLAALVARRRARADRMEREMVERMERERGLRSDETADSDKLSSDISIDC